MKCPSFSLRILSGIVVLNACAFFVLPASAQDENSKSAMAGAAPNPATVGKLTPEEVHFVKEAGGGNLAEAKLGELAQNKSTDPDVKTFGQTMIADHTKANTDLRDVAGKHGLLFEPKINTKNEAIYERLSKLSGEKFDKAYIDDMVKDHTQDAADYDKAIKDGKDDDLKKYTTDTLTVIQHHLQMAQDMKGKADAGGKK